MVTQTALGDSTAKLRSELQDSVSQISTILQDTASKISTTLAANTLAIQDTAAQIRADIPNVSGLATKTALGDSTAENRQAIIDTAAQIRITVTANTQAIQDTAAQVRADIPNVSGLATKTALSDSTAENRQAIIDTAAQIRADIPSVSGLATKTALGDSTALVRSEIPGQLADLSDVSTAAATSGNILVANGTQFKSVSVSGDITLGSDGAASIAPNSVNGSDIALGSDTKGDIMYYDGTNWVRLPAGTSGQVLQTNGSGSAPTWVTPSSGSSSTTKAVIEYSNYTVQSGVTAVIDKAASSITFTLPAAATAGSGFVLYFYSAYSTFSISTSGIIYNSNGTTGSTVSGLYSAILVSDGVNTWYQVK